MHATLHNSAHANYAMRAQQEVARHAHVEELPTLAGCTQEEREAGRHTHATLYTRE